MIKYTQLGQLGRTIVQSAITPPPLSTSSFNGAVYREPSYFPMFQDPTKYNTTYIYQDLAVRMPESVCQQIYDSDNIVLTINGFAPTKRYRGGSKYAFEDLYDNYAYFSDYFYIPNQRGGGSYDQFYISVGNFSPTGIIGPNNDPEYWGLQECGSVFVYFTTQQDIFPGTAPGVDLSVCEAAYDANKTYQIYFEVDGTVLINGTITAYTQANVQAIYDSFVCVYQGNDIPSTPWTWSGTGIAIPPEVTWIQQI